MYEIIVAECGGVVVMYKDRTRLRTISSFEYSCGVAVDCEDNIYFTDGGTDVCTCKAEVVVMVVPSKVLLSQEE